MQFTTKYKIFILKTNLSLINYLTMDYSFLKSYQPNQNFRLHKFNKRRILYIQKYRRYYCVIEYGLSLNKLSKLIQIMRKIPYTDRSHGQLDSNPNRYRQSSDFLFQPIYKQDINKLYSNIAAYLPNPGKNNVQHYYHHKNMKPSIKRPLTVNRTYSELKNKSQDKQLAVENKKELWISTVRESRQSSNSRDNDRANGRVYRGSSWKFDDRSKIQAKQLRDASRYSHASRMANNLTPSSKQQRNSLKQNYRTNGLYDLINKNLKQKKQQTKKQKKQEQFFEYVMRFSYRTKKGSIPSNPNKVNQDAYIINPNIQSKTYQHFFGVCDGHGPLGHHVSNYIKNTLPGCVVNSKTLQANPIESLMKSFESAYHKLTKQSQVDLTFSGSTIISAYMMQNKIYCCNVGDSRAIVGKYKQKDKKWGALALSQDHKPSLPKEADRISKMNGRIQSYKDQYGEQIGPLRVWLKNQNVPGLAMTRSFGDLVGASVGVSPVPQIKQFTLTQQDRIILIASDGVFQFLENIQIINQLSQFYQKRQIQQASDHLLSLAHRTWTKNSSIVDDITFILIFLNYNQV